MRSVRLAVIAALLIIQTQGACYAKGSVVPEIYTDPLLWDDLVVRGTVGRIDYSRVSAEEWYTPELLKPGMEPVDVMKTTIRVSKILRGGVGNGDVVLISRRIADAPAELEFSKKMAPGADVIATGRYNSRKSGYFARTFLVHDESGWRNVFSSKNAPYREAISESDIERRVDSVSVRAMTEASDLVLFGRVLAKRTIGPPGSERQEYDVEPETTIKGIANGPIVVATQRGFDPDEKLWRSTIPFELDSGSTWYFFLQASGQKYTPAAGLRALFRVEGERVFQREDVPCKQSRADLERQIRQFVIEQ